MNFSFSGWLVWLDSLSFWLGSGPRAPLRARGADSTKDSLDRAKLESGSGVRDGLRRGSVGRAGCARSARRDVADRPADVAYHVVVGRHVRVESSGFRSPLKRGAH